VFTDSLTVFCVGVQAFGVCFTDVRATWRIPCDRLGCRGGSDQHTGEGPGAQHLSDSGRVGGPPPPSPGQ